MYKNRDDCVYAQITHHYPTTPEELVYNCAVSMLGVVPFLYGDILCLNLCHTSPPVWRRCEIALEPEPQTKAPGLACRPCRVLP
jgi:hypothetical protein